MRLRATVAFVAALVALAPPARAQSSHLLALESASPATSADPLSSIAKSGWAGLWVNPSSDPSLTGASAGVERNPFGAVRTLAAHTALRAGLRWSVAIAQSTVSDLFDPDLLKQDATLADLRATALTVAVDGAARLTAHLAASAGVRLERDELLGEVRSGRVARVGGSAALPFGVRTAGTFDHVLSGNIGATGPARLRFGVARSWVLGGPTATLGLGAETGGLWRATQDYRALSGSLALELGRAITLGGSFGTERDLYTAYAWTQRSVFWLGIAVNPVAVQLRVGSQPGDAGSILAVAAAYTAGR